MQKAWGFHGIFNLAKCSPKLIRCPKNIELFSSTLVKKIDMVAYGKPQIIHFGVDDKKGYTLVQLIETSNIMAHFAEENNSAYIDIFSCKPYEFKSAKQVIQEFFEPENMHSVFLKRSPPEQLK